MWQYWHELRKSQILALMSSALGCGVWGSLWDDAQLSENCEFCTTNCCITLEAVLDCQVIHRVCLRVSNSRSIDQISAGLERAIIAHGINNHLVLFMSPVWERDPCSVLVHLVPGQHPGALTSLMFCSHSRLPALPSPSQHCPASGSNCTGGFTASQLHLPSTLSSDALPWAKDSHPSPKNAGAQAHQVMCLHLLKHLFHTVLGQVSIPAQNNGNGHTF